MVVVYKGSPISYKVVKMMAKVSFISLVNLVAEEEVVPEVIQNDVVPERLAGEALKMLENEEVRRGMIEKMARVKERLGNGGASERTAKIALEMMK